MRARAGARACACSLHTGVCSVEPPYVQPPVCCALALRCFTFAMTAAQAAKVRPSWESCDSWRDQPHTMLVQARQAALEAELLRRKNAVLSSPSAPARAPSAAPTTPGRDAPAVTPLQSPTWEALRCEGNAAHSSGDSGRAVKLYTEALQLLRAGAQRCHLARPHLLALPNCFQPSTANRPQTRRQSCSLTEARRSSSWERTRRWCLTARLRWRSPLATQRRCTGLPPRSAH